MSVQHFVDRPYRLVVSTFSGHVTLDEIATACTKLRNDHDFQPTYRQLADFSKVSRLALHPEDISTIRLTYDPFSQQSRRAFVATDRDTFGTVEAYGSVVDSVEFAVFPSMLDALCWLDLEVTVLQAARIKTSFRTEVGSSFSFHLPDNMPRSFRTQRGPLKKSSSSTH